MLSAKNTITLLFHCPRTRLALGVDFAMKIMTFNTHKALFVLPVIALSAMLSFPGAVGAQGFRPDVDFAYTVDKPLTVIRFNQRVVYYERPLYGAVSQAVEAKPTVMFELVAASPVYGSASEQKKQREMTGQAGGRVLKTMRDMGVPQSRMSYTLVQDPSLEFPEVRVYVR